MGTFIRNTLAIVLGWLGGSVLNMALVQIGHGVFPIEGWDPNDMEALAAVMPTLGSQYFIFPFLAHALGTLLGAFLAGWIAGSHKRKYAMAIGILFLVGGIMVNYMLPGPIWFAVIDVTLAYIPMAWLGGSFALKLRKSYV